jgi:chemotaxis protein methyltransferase CheR
MQYRVDSLGVSGTVTTILRDLIHERLGLMYEPHQFDQVADRLAPLVIARGLTSFLDYYYFLKYADGEAEWPAVMDALAVPETYFWREIDQIRAVVHEIVPSVIDTLQGRPLRIWSIPCASGEEPLTIAMLLEEAGWFRRATIELVGSDASPAAIGRARKGRYGERSFRNLPVAMRDKYFTPHEGASVVSPDLQRRVSYDIVNLMDAGQMARHASSSIVFCRNVFIYFSDHSIQRALRVLEGSMPCPAYLCVAAAESLLRRTTIFELQDIGGAFIYVKGAASRASRPFSTVDTAS